MKCLCLHLSIHPEAKLITQERGEVIEQALGKNNNICHKTSSLIWSFDSVNDQGSYSSLRRDLLSKIISNIYYIQEKAFSLTLCNWIILTSRVFDTLNKFFEEQSNFFSNPLIYLTFLSVHLKILAVSSPTGGDRKLRPSRKCCRAH